MKYSVQDGLNIRSCEANENQNQFENLHNTFLPHCEKQNREERTDGAQHSWKNLVLISESSIIRQDV